MGEGILRGGAGTRAGGIRRSGRAGSIGRSSRAVGTGSVKAANGRGCRDPVTAFVNGGFTVFAGDIPFRDAVQDASDLNGVGAPVSESVSAPEELLVRGIHCSASHGASVGQIQPPEAASGPDGHQGVDHGVVGVDFVADENVLAAVSVGNFQPYGRVVTEAVLGLPDPPGSRGVSGRPGRSGVGSGAASGGSTTIFAIILPKTIPHGKILL